MSSPRPAQISRGGVVLSWTVRWKNRPASASRRPARSMVPPYSPVRMRRQISRPVSWGRVDRTAAAASGRARQVDGEDPVGPAAQRMEPELTASLRDVAEDDALLARLVEAAPLGTAGIGIRRLAGRFDAAERMYVPQRQVIEARGGDLRLADAVV